jgi:serine/threonine protein kinase/Tol biopolymer transport system component
MIPTGTVLGRYEIRSQLGAGGMGEVYRARDEKLNRDVAVKVLPAALSHDGDRLRRFEQEAQAAGALNHPNILAVYDVGTHDGAPYIVSELLEGEELRDQLNTSPLPQRKALDYAQQIAQGLAAAHERGITHRDLKPENLFVTTDGRVKILDFGLAKLRPRRSESVSSEIDTRKQITDPGTVMGTVGYMSPEQVRGHEADHRSDIFSFGSILYEMLSGQRAFRRDTMAETMTAILKEEPPELSETNAKISLPLEKIVRRCLEKKPERRFHSASDLAFAIESIAGTPTSSGQTETMTALPALRLRTRERIAWLLAGVLLVAPLALAFLYFRRTPTESSDAVRFFITAPEKSSFSAAAAGVAVSPDGRHLAFVATTADGKRLLWVRSLDALSARALPGTEDAINPFWSPDSRSLGFFADGKLKKIEAAGGPTLTLGDAPNGRGGTWNRDGVILFTPNTTAPLYRISASGGVASAVTKLDEGARRRQDRSHRWPSFLPDGNHFLYVGVGIRVASLDSPEGKLLPLNPGSNAVYAQGHLLFMRERTLMAQPFDVKRLETTGDAIPIAEQVQVGGGGAKGAFSVSEQGVLTYQTGAAESGSQLTWFDRSGKQTGVLGDLANYASLHFSPDGKRAAVSIGGRNGDIWLYDVARGLRTRLTFDPEAQHDVIWAPDGNRLVFNSTRKGRLDLYQKGADGSGSEEMLVESDVDKYPNSWSRDGRFVLYSTAFDVPKTKTDLWVLPLSGDRKPFPFLQTEFNETRGQFSPDGSWIAYQSDESGRDEVYVASFPGPGGKRQISTVGGSFPRWRSDGKEIFYLSPDNKLMGVEINHQGATLDIGAARVLFDVRPGNPISGYQYDVTSDGQHFLVNTSLEQKVSSPITVVINWMAGLKK